MRLIAICALLTSCVNSNRFSHECCEELCKVAKERDSLEILVKKYEANLE